MVRLPAVAVAWSRVTLAALALAGFAASLAAQTPAPTASPDPLQSPSPAPNPTPNPSPTPTPCSPTGPLGPADPKGLGTANVLGQDSGQVTSEKSFNPALSVILDGLYYADDRAGSVGGLLEEADGLQYEGAGDGHSHGGAPERGFSLREAEISFSGSVDPYFDLWTILAISDGEIEIEEGYVQTRKFLPGLQIKAGKFNSGFGYLNRQHPHQWDFVEQALPYEALLRGSLNETGVQLTWLPKLPFYAQLGVEALQGENEGLSAQLGSEANPLFDEKPGPRLFTGFLKVAPNVGYGHAVQFGLSHAFSRRHQETRAAEPEATIALQGDAWLLGLDFVWKYDSSQSYGRKDFTLQAEYLRRVRDLEVVAEGEVPREPRVPTEATQDGLYAQVVYGILARWTVGLRWDAVGLTNRIRSGAERHDLRASTRYSASLTFNPTEFSRLRAQFDHGDFRVGGARETFNQFFVQFQMSLGAHGAHRF